MAYLDPFTPAFGLDEVLAKVRDQLYHHYGSHVTGPAALAKCLEAAAEGGNGISHYNFEDALKQCGVFLGLGELHSLERHFDTRPGGVGGVGGGGGGGSGFVSPEVGRTALRTGFRRRLSCDVWSDMSRRPPLDCVSHSSLLCRHRVFRQAFLAALKLPLSERRSKAVDAAYRLCDPANSGSVPVENVLTAMKPEKDPEVLAGKINADAVGNDLKSWFERRGAAEVTPETFREYFAAWSEVEPYDTQFCRRLEEIFNLHESSDYVAVRDSLARPNTASIGSRIGEKGAFEELAQTLLEKVREHSSDAKTPQEVLATTFKFFNKDGSGSITLQEFAQSLQHYGLWLSDAVYKHIFDRFAKGGKVLFSTFVDAVCAADK